VFIFVGSEMWPDRREFGVEGMAPEEEFMALREICFTELPSLSLISLFVTAVHCRCYCSPPGPFPSPVFFSTRVGYCANFGCW